MIFNIFTHWYHHAFNREIIIDADMVSVSYARYCKCCHQYQWAADLDNCSVIWHANTNSRSLDDIIKSNPNNPPKSWHSL